MNERAPCPECAGTGRTRSACWTCYGEGRAALQRCPTCRGTGELHDACLHCDGSGDEPEGRVELMGPLLF